MFSQWDPFQEKKVTPRFERTILSHRCLEYQGIGFV
jgi:hypothetical protein